MEDWLNKTCGTCRSNPTRRSGKGCWVGARKVCSVTGKYVTIFTRSCGLYKELKAKGVA